MSQVECFSLRLLNVTEEAVGSQAADEATQEVISGGIQFTIDTVSEKDTQKWTDAVKAAAKATVGGVLSSATHSGMDASTVVVDDPTVVSANSNQGVNVSVTYNARVPVGQTLATLGTSQTAIEEKLNNASQMKDQLKSGIDSADSSLTDDTALLLTVTISPAVTATWGKQVGRYFAICRS